MYARGNPEELSSELYDEASSVAGSSGAVSWLGRRRRRSGSGSRRHVGGAHNETHSGSPRGSASGSVSGSGSGSGSSASGEPNTLLEALNGLTASVEDVLNELSDNYTFEVRPEYRLKLRKRCVRAAWRCACACAAAAACDAAHARQDAVGDAGCELRGAGGALRAGGQARRRGHAAVEGARRGGVGRRAKPRRDGSERAACCLRAVGRRVRACVLLRAT
jgi:hypothetical protein